MSSPANNEMLSRLLKRLDQATKTFEWTPTSHAERALWHLLVQHRDKLPPLDERFHKSFRQMDCIDGHTDAAIWNLLTAAPTFWRLFEEVQGEKEVA